MFRILIVEDEPDIGELLQNYLEHAGYVTRLAQEGQGALTLFYQETFDLVLLDLMLPKMDGYTVCQAIREQSDVPVIMVTALDSEEHQLQGFRFNIDDYVTKPFSIPVLLQKIRAVLRRTTGHAGDEPICYRNLTLDLEGYQAYLGGTPCRFDKAGDCTAADPVREPGAGSNPADAAQPCVELRFLRG